MQNLDYIEREQWKKDAAGMRATARCNPCYDPRMVNLDDFAHTLGPWNLRLVLETYVKPAIWHGSISYFKEVGYEPVFDKETGKQIFEAPQTALLKVADWTPEELDIARNIMGDMFGAMIQGEHQRVNEVRSQLALHWITREEDARKAATLQ